MAEGKTPNRDLRLERNKAKSQDGQPSGSESREELVDMLGGLIDKLGDLEHRIADAAPEAEAVKDQPAQPTRKRPSKPKQPLAARRAKSIRSRIKPTRVGEEPAKSGIEQFGMPDWRANVVDDEPPEPETAHSDDPMIALETEGEAPTPSGQSQLGARPRQKGPRRIVAQRVPSWAKEGYFTEDPQFNAETEPAGADPVFGIERIADQKAAAEASVAEEGDTPSAPASAQPVLTAEPTPGLARPITPIGERPESPPPPKRPGFFGRLFGRGKSPAVDEDRDFIGGGVPVRLDPTLGAETETPTPEPNIALEAEPAAEEPQQAPVPGGVAAPPGVVFEQIEDLTAPAGPRVPDPLPEGAQPTPPQPAVNQTDQASMALPDVLPEPPAPAADLGEDVDKLASTLAETMKEDAAEADPVSQAAESASDEPEKAAVPDDVTLTGFDRPVEDAPEQAEDWAAEVADATRIETSGEAPVDGGLAGLPKTVLPDEGSEQIKPTAAAQPDEASIADDRGDEGDRHQERADDEAAGTAASDATDKEPAAADASTEEERPDEPVTDSAADDVAPADDAPEAPAVDAAASTIGPDDEPDDQATPAEVDAEAALPADSEPVEKTATTPEKPEEKTVEPPKAEADAKPETEAKAEAEVAATPADAGVASPVDTEAEQATEAKTAEKADEAPPEPPEQSAPEAPPSSAAVGNEDADAPEAEDADRLIPEEEEDDEKPKLTDDVEHPFGSLVAELKSPVEGADPDGAQVEAAKESEPAEGTEKPDTPFEAVDDEPGIPTFGPTFEEPARFEEPPDDDAVQDPGDQPAEAAADDKPDTDITKPEDTGAETTDESGADVSGADVSGADVSGADESGTDESGGEIQAAVDEADQAEAEKPADPPTEATADTPVKSDEEAASESIPEPETKLDDPAEDPRQPELPMEPAIAAAAMAADAQAKSDDLVATHQRVESDADSGLPDHDDLDDDLETKDPLAGTRESLREKAARLAAAEAETATAKGVNWPRVGLIAAGLVVLVGGAAMLGPWRGGDAPETAEVAESAQTDAASATTAPAQATDAQQAAESEAADVTEIASESAVETDGATDAADQDAAQSAGDAEPASEPETTAETETAADTGAITGSPQDQTAAAQPEPAPGAEPADETVASLPPAQTETSEQPTSGLSLNDPEPVLATLADAPLPDSASPTLLRIAQEAVSGDPLRQQDLANVYALGQQVPQSFERAVFWYRRAGENGVINAQYNLAVLTERGLGTDRDVAGAVELYRRVARQGHGPAGNALGTAYLEGKHVAQDVDLAAGWFRAAAEAGEARGAMNLARLYERGLDGPPNLTAAAGWYQRASNMGMTEGQDALDRLLAANPEIIPDTGRLPGLPADSPTALPEPEVTVDILSMTDSERTREIQRHLTDLGYEPGPVDGLMGSRTRAAIEAFEQDIGRPSQGEPTNYVLAALRLASLQLDSAN